MHSVRLILACLLFIGCQVASAEVPSDETRIDMKGEHLDISKLSDSIFDRYDKVGYSKLSQPQRVFVCVWVLQGDVENGGFDQYYFNSAGDHAQDTVGALNAIGAKHTANLVQQANSLFGVGGPSSDRSTRQKQLDELGDDKMAKMNEFDEEFFKDTDNLEEMLKKYVAENESAFGIK